MNIVILEGRITRDLDLRQGRDGKAYLPFTLAVDGTAKDKDEFVNCIAFDKTAEVIAKYSGKGKRLGIRGAIRNGSYEKDGQKHYTTDIVAERCFLTDTTKKETLQENAAEGFTAGLDDEGLPFE